MSSPFRFPKKSGDPIADTRRRAELRGREAEALSQIGTGVLAANLYGAFMGLNTVINLFGGNVKGAVIGALWTAGFVVSGIRMRQGSRFDAIALFILFLVTGGLVGLIGEVPWFLAIPIWLAGLMASGNAIRGASSLAQIRRDADAVPGGAMLLNDELDND